MSGATDIGHPKIDPTVLRSFFLGPNWSLTPHSESFALLSLPYRALIRLKSLSRSLVLLLYSGLTILHVALVVVPPFLVVVRDREM